MINIQRLPDDFYVICDNESTDASVRFDLTDNGLDVYLRASESKPRYVCLRWNYRATEKVSVLGDKWERAYADLTWKSLDGENFMPWYFLATNGKDTVGCGVMTRPESFVCFQYDASGVTGWFDVRCGDAGVHLEGREIKIGTVVTREYADTPSFEAACKFCRVLCPDPILPAEPVYGGNNWYYAYGNSSASEICSDSKLIADLSKGNKVRPFMVIDDGWQENPCDGPWHCGNERFPDMAALAEGMKQAGVRPGIWIRYLNDSERQTEGILPEHRMPNDNKYLDPSHPDILALVTRDTKRIVD